MRSILSVWLIGFAFQISVYAQNQGSENSALGVTGIANTSLFSINSNPANLGVIDSSSIGLLVKQVALNGRALTSGLQLAIPIKNIHAGLGVYNFGNNFYNFGQVNFSLAKVLDAKQGLGISVKYFREFVYLNSNENAINASIGYYYKLSPKLRLGAKVQQVFYRSNKRLERTYSQIGSEGGVGLQLMATSSLTFNTEIVVNEINTMRLGAGVKFNKDKYALMLGFSSHESLVNAGLSIPVNSFMFGLAYGYHQHLGSNVQTSLIYSW